jgi:chaperonin GroEL
MKPSIPYRDIITGEEYQRRAAEGVAAVYEVAKAAYGPGAGNVLLENSYHMRDPLLSRDGVTNLQRIFLKDSVSNMVARTIIQASKKNNQTVGDGTTAVTILAAHLYNQGRKLVTGGYNRMEVSRMIEDSAVQAVKYVESISKKVADNELVHVAKVSCGDDALGELISDTLLEVGSEGGVTVEEHTGLGVYNEVIDGFYMRKGFSDLRLVEDMSSLSSDFVNVPILLLGKTITEAKEMRSILDRIVAAGHTKMIILGDVMQEALDVLVRRRVDSKGQVTPTLAAIPATAGMKTVALEDLAILTGGTVYQDGQQSSSFTVDYLGAAERAIVTELSTTIIGGAGDSEAIKKRCDELEAQLEAEVHPVTTTFLKDRIARLKGKVGIVKVGAATDVDREELRLRVDDAVSALQAARKGGIVPGGGTALARVKGTPFDETFHQLFLELADNVGANSQLMLGKLLEKPVGYGYDLKNLTADPIDLQKAGVVDPTLVITEAVRNAASVASKLITATVGITFAKEENGNSN